MTITIAVVNESTVLTDGDVVKIVAACQAQVTNDLIPAWSLDDAVLGFVPKGDAPPPNDWLCAILDDSDQAGALGYHDVTAKFQPLCKVFAKTDLQNGYSPSVTTSHELCEMLVNPHLENSALRTMEGAPDRWYFREPCDACEADNLGYDIDGVRVSDFVTPAFFGGSSAPYDHLGHITAPYQILAGGYLAYYAIGEGWKQDFSQSYRNQGEEYAEKSRFRRLLKSHWRPSTRFAATTSNDH